MTHSWVPSIYDSVWANVANKVHDGLDFSRWANQDCYILAGGASVKLAGFDLNKLKDKNVITVNRSVFDYGESQINFAMDLSFLESIYAEVGSFKTVDAKNKWANYKGLKLFLCPSRVSDIRVEGKDLIYFIRRIVTQEISRDIHLGISSVTNSGLAAILLALALHAKRIFVLGMDMKLNGNSLYWHECHNVKSAQEYSTHFDSFISNTLMYAQLLKDEQVFLVGDPKYTALNCFPIKSYVEVFG